MKVRQLTSRDWQDALALYRDLMGKGPVLDDRAQFDRVLAHPGTTLFGAEANGQIRAMATLHLLPNITWGGRPYALIENVVTLRACQGQGLGRAVMQAAIEHAWAKDAYKIMLLTGRTAGARAFYEKLGFAADNKWGMTLRRVPNRQARD